MRILSAFLWFSATITFVLPAHSAGEAPSQPDMSIINLLGKVMPGVTLSTTSQGKEYHFTVDMPGGGAPREGAGFDKASITGTIAPLGGGNWRVSDMTFIGPLQFALGNLSLSYTYENGHLDGVFVPQLGFFQDLSGRFGKMTASTVSPAANLRDVFSNTTFELSSQKIAEGTITTNLHQSIGPSVSMGKIAVAPSHVVADYTTTSTSLISDLTISSLRSAGLIHLLARHSAGTARPVATGEPADFKDEALALLPLFDSMKIAATRNNVTIRTAGSVLSIGKIVTELDGTGLVADAHYGLRLRFSGIAGPGGLANTWLARLMPTEFDLGASLSGLDLAGAAKAAIAALDFSKAAVFGQNAQPLVVAALLDNGPIKVTLAPSHFVSSALQIEVRGEATAALPRPKVHLDVSAKGVSGTLILLKSAPSGDKLAQSALALLQSAAALGKPAADGSLVWTIDLGVTGSAMVNGKTLGKS